MLSRAGGIVFRCHAAALATLDVIKTRLMLKVDKHGREYKGLVSTCRRIVVDEGAAALLNGIVPAFLDQHRRCVFFGWIPGRGKAAQAVHRLTTAARVGV